MQVTGKAIKTLRQARGLSQERLAEVLGVTRQAVGRWEEGGGIETARLSQIAKALAVPVETLFQDPIRFMREFPHAEEGNVSYTESEALDDGAGHAPLLTLDQIRQIARAKSEEEAMAALPSWPRGADGIARARLRVSGDALDDGTREAIPDGTEAVFALHIPPQHGDRILAVLEDDRVLVRRYDVTGEGILLVATNPSFPGRVMPMPASARIVGVLEYTVRRYR